MLGRNVLASGILLNKCEKREFFAVNDVLLQLEHGGCKLFLDVPWASPTRIVVSCAQSAGPTTKNDALLIFNALDNLLVQLCRGRQTPLCGGSYYGTGNCMADSNPDAERDVNILVIVEDPHADYDLATAQTFLAKPGAMILPVCKAGSRAQPSPGFVTSIIFPYPAAQPEIVAPEVLYAAQIGDDLLRVFISYRHADCAAIAAQVFHKLAENRYSVFLDRFSGDPGHDFVGLILSELFDKGILLVLEATNTHLSTWVQHETATALAHHLGIFKVNLAGSPDILPADASIDLNINASIPPVSPTDTLSTVQLDAIFNAFRTQHPLMAAERRRHLDQTIETAAQYAVQNLGARDNGRRQGLRCLTGQYGQEIGLCASARPLGAARFHLAAEAAGRARVRGILTGPLVNQLPGQAGVTDWMGQISGVTPVDEGALLQIIGRLL